MEPWSRPPSPFPFSNAWLCLPAWPRPCAPLTPFPAGQRTPCTPLQEHLYSKHKATWVPAQWVPSPACPCLAPAAHGRAWPQPYPGAGETCRPVGSEQAVRPCPQQRGTCASPAAWCWAVGPQQPCRPQWSHSGSVQGTNHHTAHPQTAKSDSKTPPAWSSSPWGTEIPSGAAPRGSRPRAARHSRGQ